MLPRIKASASFGSADITTVAISVGRWELVPNEFHCDAALLDCKQLEVRRLEYRSMVSPVLRCCPPPDGQAHNTPKAGMPAHVALVRASIA